MEIYTAEIKAMLSIAKSVRGQSSIEYLMMLSAVSIVIVVALAMITQLKGAALHTFFNGTNGSVISTLKTEMENITKAS